MSRPPGFVGIVWGVLMTIVGSLGAIAAFIALGFAVTAYLGNTPAPQFVEYRVAGNYTLRIPSGATGAWIHAVGAGSSGGAGSCADTTTTATIGGPGGTPGSVTIKKIDLTNKDVHSATTSDKLIVIVGKGGAATAAASSCTGGSTVAAGTATSGTNTLVSPRYADGTPTPKHLALALGGVGGSNSGATHATFTFYDLIDTLSYGTTQAGVSADVGRSGSDNTGLYFPTGGGAGGGLTTANVTKGGGSGGNIIYTTTLAERIAGGAGGAAGAVGAAGHTTTDFAFWRWAGTGGGGGGSNNVIGQTGFAGGAGGGCGGAGGGGGSGRTTGGTGGAGADGCVRIIWSFA